MTDDWSLKGLDEFPFPTDETSCLEKFYWQKDIETLRQKLVNDFIAYAAEHEKRMDGITIEEIINKRFGVD